MVRTLEHFHKYLYGQLFHLRTDHSALTWLLSFRNLEGQTECWIQRLQEYNFTSEYAKAGSTTTPMIFQDDHGKMNVRIAKSRYACRRKTSVSYCSSTCSRLGSDGAEKETAKRPRHMAHSTGIINRTTTGMQLGIRQRTISYSPNSYSSE
jgi:hypothetical protein